MRKYIANDDLGVIDFEEHIRHADFASRLGMVAQGAGFITRDTSGRLICIGESTSLGLKARPEDTERLNNSLRR